MVLMFIVILGVTMLTFLIMHFTPGDPAEMIALARHGAESLTPENIERIRVEEGLDAPVHIQPDKRRTGLIRDFGQVPGDA